MSVTDSTIPDLAQAVRSYQYTLVEVCLCDAFNKGLPKTGKIAPTVIDGAGAKSFGRYSMIELAVAGTFARLAVELHDAYKVLEGLSSEPPLPKAVDTAINTIAPLYNRLLNLQKVQPDLTFEHHSTQPKGSPEMDESFYLVHNMMADRYPVLG